MNIAVYVTSNYSNYDEFSKLLPKYLGKYTTSPVLLTASSRSTKDGHGNQLVKRYADEHKLKCKVYETEWNKWRKSAGSIASYHISHNSERSIVFWDGMSKGCKNLLQMAVRLNRPCDLVRINTGSPNVPDEERPKQEELPQGQQRPQRPQSSNAPSPQPSAEPSPSVGGGTSTDVPRQGGQQQGSDGGTASPTASADVGTPEQNGPKDAISKEFVKNAVTVQQNPQNAAQQNANSQNGAQQSEQPSQSGNWAVVKPTATTSAQQSQQTQQTAQSQQPQSTTEQNPEENEKAEQ